MLRSTLTIIKLILFYFVYQLGFGGITTVISRFLVPMSPITSTSLAMVASTIMMGWHLTHFGYVRIAQDRYKEVSLATLGGSMVFIFSAMYALNVLIEQAGIPNTLEDTFLAMARNPLGMLSIAVLAPVLEELLFRGAIQGQLLSICKRPWEAIVISSLIFGIVHMNPAQIPFAFLLGAMFGWLYYRTGSLLPGIVGHVLNNSTATFGMILYGDTTIEEQMQSPQAMWLCVTVATVICILSAVWLNKTIRQK